MNISRCSCICSENPEEGLFTSAIPSLYTLHAFLGAQCHSLFACLSLSDGQLGALLPAMKSKTKRFLPRASVLFPAHSSALVPMLMKA
jgi:hypothetical protein